MAANSWSSLGNENAINILIIYWFWRDLSTCHPISARLPLPISILTVRHGQKSWWTLKFLPIYTELTLTRSKPCEQRKRQVFNVNENLQTTTYKCSNEFGRRWRRFFRWNSEQRRWKWRRWKWRVRLVNTIECWFQAQIPTRADMLNIIQEFQSRSVCVKRSSITHRNSERKAKTATTSLNTFQNQKTALYTQARQNAYNAAKDGNDYL